MQLLFWNRSLDTAAGKERDDLTEMPQIVENDNNGDPDVCAGWSLVYLYEYE